MKNSQVSPFSFPYASLANYSPRGSDEVSLKSRSVCFAIKNDTSDIISKAAQSLAGNKGVIIKDYFGENPIFIPTPRSSLLQTNALWPALRIIDEMLNAGIAGSKSLLLQRNVAVNKSSTSSPGTRPTVEDHVNSISCSSTSLLPNNFVLVDDVITKGATLFACAHILKSNFPRATIKTFALIRTQGLVQNINKFVDPSIGDINYNGYSITRKP